MDGQADQSICSNEALLPEGIERASEEAIAASRLIQDLPHGTSEDPVIVAAFDFDGTCISGSSPKRLVKLLGLKRRITPYTLFRVMLWGAAYKLNLPKDAEGVRTRVFSAFAGFCADKVNRFLEDFYHEQVEPLYRGDADAAMFAHIEAGHVVILVSASFEPIIASAMQDHPIQFALASRMKIDNEGRYTDIGEGLPTEGPDKIVVLRQFCDDYFGEGAWRLGWAYGDHFSDVSMLEKADHPCAVTPDGKLRRYSHTQGWDVLDWV